LTALITAVQEGKTETVHALVKAGADVNLQDKVSKLISYESHWVVSPYESWFVSIYFMCINAYIILVP